MTGKEKGNTVYKIPPHFAWRKVESEVVVLNLQSSHYFSLNEVGSRIWELIDQGKDETRIAEAIHREYSVRPSAAAEDVRTFLGQLKKEKLIEPA